MRDVDTSYPIDFAEREIGAKPGSVSLDEAARRLSLMREGETLSVREWRLSPIRHSKVYRDGSVTGAVPYLMTSTGK